MKGTACLSSPASAGLSVDLSAPGDPFPNGCTMHRTSSPEPRKKQNLSSVACTSVPATAAEIIQPREPHILTSEYPVPILALSIPLRTTTLSSASSGGTTTDPIIIRSRNCPKLEAPETNSHMAICETNPKRTNCFRLPALSDHAIQSSPGRMATPAAADPMSPISVAESPFLSKNRTWYGKTAPSAAKYVR